MKQDLLVEDVNDDEDAESGVQLAYKFLLKSGSVGDPSVLLDSVVERRRLFLEVLIFGDVRFGLGTALAKDHLVDSSVVCECVAGQEGAGGSECAFSHSWARALGKTRGSVSLHGALHLHMRPRSAPTCHLWAVRGHSPGQRVTGPFQFPHATVGKL